MKPWPLVGSGAERCGAPGLFGLAADARQSADPRSASICRVPASTLPSTSIVGATPERMRPHERSDGGS
ncbi:MAG: hypothetical protein QOE04_2769 [Mycobacterium sp.]|jgi:hypothetical protein|nr:hypothetical protein [Mycobacterium sp.]